MARLRPYVPWANSVLSGDYSEARWAFTTIPPTPPRTEKLYLNVGGSKLFDPENLNLLWGPTEFFSIGISLVGILMVFSFV